MKTITFLLGIVLFSQSYAQTNSWTDTINKIENLFSRYKAENPGCQLAISRNGRTIFSKAWGMSDLEHNVPLSTESIIEAGSVSKQITAAAILLLEQQGKLSINDNVRKFLPELPAYASSVKLSHMLHHTSGLRDWGSVMALAGWPRGTKTYSNEDALYVASIQQALNNKPGAEFIYSNTNYNLFAVIVKRVSGMSLAEYTRKYIFEPAGMKHTEWRDNFKKVVPHRAIAYAKIEKGYETDMPNEYVYGNGGLLTTAEDLLAWNNYYSSGSFGSPSLFQKQISLMPLNNANNNSYAAGLFVSKQRGWTLISHNGATASYRSNLELYPDLGLSIAWLSNTSQYDTAKTNLFALVTNLLVKDTSTTAPPQPKQQVNISPDVFTNQTGWYRDGRSGSAFKIYLKEGKLYSTPSFLLTPASENAVTLGSVRLEFFTEKFKGLRYIPPTKDTVIFKLIDTLALNSNNIDEYAGEYYSAEAEAKYIVTVKDGKLHLRQGLSVDKLLTPTYKDGFVAEGNCSLF
jgi:CubicO group peptidase (beta-lactamase class C family)